MAEIWEVMEGESSLEDAATCVQQLINSGDAWRLSGAEGRQCMSFIDAGICMLGKEPHNDYWGNYVPSRSEVVEGTKGSRGFVEQHHPELLPLYDEKEL